MATQKSFWGMLYSIIQLQLLILNQSHQRNRKKTKQKTHCNIEIDDSLILIKSDWCRFHTDVGDINGAGKEEKHSQARKQEAEHHWQAHIQFTVKHRFDQNYFLNLVKAQMHWKGLWVGRIYVWYVIKHKS